MLCRQNHEGALGGKMQTLYPKAFGIAWTRCSRPTGAKLGIGVPELKTLLILRRLTLAIARCLKGVALSFDA